MNKLKEKGFALILSLVLLMAMSLMSVGLIIISSEDHKSNNVSDEYQQSFYLAEMALLTGEQYLLNQKNGPYNDAGVKQTALANLPQNLSPVPAWDGTMTRRNYTTDSVTGTNCYNSFKDIDRIEFKHVVAESWHFGKLLSDSSITSDGSQEDTRLNNFYYEYFITRIGDATFMGQGSSITLGSGGVGKNGVAYRVYGCGIFNGSEQMIVSLESVIVLPK
tara:strand:+ start:2218 stop:2877 length:660 start_codon:yes stop_codon:yes gene_type:complete